MVREIIKACGGAALDFVLPPRCAGCGLIVADLHSFCPDCWKQIEFLGEGGCMTCGLPLQATEADECGACLARPPRIERTRAAVAYDDLSRGVAIRLKYGRNVALARTMARYMAPLIHADERECLLVPYRCTVRACGGAATTDRPWSLPSFRAAYGSQPILMSCVVPAVPHRSKV